MTKPRTSDGRDEAVDAHRLEAEARQHAVERLGAEIVEHHDEQEFRQRPDQRRVDFENPLQILAAGELAHGAAKSEHQGRRHRRRNEICSGAERTGQKIAAPGAGSSSARRQRTCGVPSDCPMTLEMGRAAA